MGYKFILTQQEAQLLITGLGELPLKQSAVLFNKLVEEMQKQDKASAIPINTLTTVVPG